MIPSLSLSSILRSPLLQENNTNVLLRNTHTKGSPRKAPVTFYPVETRGKEEPLSCPVYLWFGFGSFLSGEQSRIPAVSGKSKQMKQTTNHFSKTWSQTGLAAGVAVEANFPEYLQSHL